MSRWAALFRSLSGDTTDTADTTPAMGRRGAPEGDGSVGSVRCVPLESMEGPPAASLLLAAAQAGAEALAEPDPDLDHERAEIAAALAAEADGGFGQPATPERHRVAVAGLLRGSLNAGPQPIPEMPT